jgi:geranylgeranyl diphosphate synthase type II
LSSGTVSSPLLDRLESLRAAVDAALDRWLPTEADCPAALAAAIRYAVFPAGKRLRPMLVLLGCEACGGRHEAALPAACAVELVHCYSLVHDDLPAMDDDDLRRGRPTCHKQFGEALAILAGDALLTLAFETLARHCETPALVAASVRELAAAAGAAGMVGGQADDIATVIPDDALGRIQSIHARKTGALLRASVRLGGLAAAAGPDAMAALDGYGRNIGLLFQIADDLLDAHGEESKAGKRVGKDAGRGKLTYPAIVGAEQSWSMAHELCEEACDQLEPLGSRAEPLRELARFILERDR